MPLYLLAVIFCEDVAASKLERHKELMVAEYDLIELAVYP